MPNKILVISTTPFYGGGESFIVNTLSKVFEDMAYYVVSTRLFDELYGKEVYLFRHKSLIGQIKEIRRFLLNNKDFNCVLFNGGNTIFFTPFITNIKKIYYRHTTNSNIAGGLMRIVYIILWHICYYYCSKIIHVSKYSLREQKFFRSKAECIYHGVDLDTSRIFRKSVSTFLYVGRLDKDKGLDIIIDTFLKYPLENTRLNIVGGGEMESYVKSIENSNIHYYGFQSDVASFYETADVLITLPTNEAFGLTIIEAMKFSLPVITCNTGGIGEIVEDHYNGLLISRTSESLISAMTDICNNIQLYSKLSYNSYSTIKLKFIREETIQRIKNVIL